MSYTTEIVRNIWDDSEGVALTVGPDGDSLGLIELRTHDEKAAEYYGKVRLTMKPEQAVKIGQALLDAAQDALKADGSGR